MKKIRIFHYVSALDAFEPTSEYAELAEDLGLAEWTPVVWIGRLFCMDNDYGEHWFDNWDQREARRAAAERAGVDADQLLIVDARSQQSAHATGGTLPAAARSPARRAYAYGDDGTCWLRQPVKRKATANLGGLPSNGISVPVDVSRPHPLIPIAASRDSVCGSESATGDA